jgi:eukaryotic-like serine/threonine-protein kinase
MGNCRLTAHLNRGGMGDIYAADHLFLGRPVAIKLPRFDDDRLLFNQQRLLSEARFLAAVSHPNVVGVHDMGLTEERLGYLVMELLDGSSMDQVMDRVPLFMFPEILHFTKEIARGIVACHRAGVICTDIKPDNIMVVHGPLVGRPEKGAVWTKIIDLGTARSAKAEADRSPDSSATVIGTPAYMSPEMALGLPLDPRADIYSLGTLLYELVAGRPPFVDPEPEVVLEQHVYFDPPPISQHREDLAPDCAMERLLNRCLAKSPAGRPETATDFLNELDRASRSLPETQFQPRSRRSVARPSQKRLQTAVVKMGRKRL